MMKKTKFLISLILAFFYASIYAQTLPVPKLLDVKTYTAKGAGANGIPIINYTMPAGNDRAVIILVHAERNHITNGSNFFNPDTAYNPSIYINGVNFDPYIPSMGAIGARYPSLQSGSPAFSSYQMTYSYTEYNGGLAPSTNSLLITFPTINTPKSANDEMIVVVMTYENVRATRVGSVGDNANSSSTYNGGAAPTYPGVYSLSAGRTFDENIMGVHGYITSDVALSLSAGWTVDANVRVNNSGTSPAGGYSSENDGIALIAGHTINPNKSPSPVSITRPNSNNVIQFSADDFSLYPFASPSISGNVYLDTDGPANINGTGTNAGGLYVNVIDSNNNLVYSATVGIAGNFTIPNRYVLERRTYNLQLSKNTGSIGTTTPVKALPSGWTTVGENATSVSPYPNDGTNDGTINLTIGAANVTGLRFGVYAASCNAGTTAPSVQNLTNACPATTVDLNTAHTGTVPAGASLVWFTNNTHTGTALFGTEITQAGAGTYYAFYYDSVANCYSPASSAVTVIINPCFVCPPDPYAAQMTWWLANGFGTPIHPIIIDFKTGSPVVTTPSTGYGNGFPYYLNSAGLGYEGNTTVTHPVTKEFLFATDGNTLFRGSDGVKASGSNVGGGKSAGEAAAVIPDPNGILGQSFLILGNSSWNTPGGLNISKYNLATNTLSNLTTLLPNGSIYEGLEVVPHTNGIDYWILVNTVDQKVKAYLYSKASGFNSTAVSSTDVSNLAGTDPSFVAVDSFISWDPRNPSKLLIARDNKIGLASFDPSTGTLGIWDVKVTYSTGNPDSDKYTGYSAVLSPNGRYIYYGTGYDKLMYYDINTSTSSQLATISAHSGLKIGPDNKLYVVGYPSSDPGLFYYATPDNPSPSTAVLPLLNTGGYSVPLQLPNNVYWGCITCQSGTAAPALASATITSNPATVGDLIALLSASNQPAGTVITIHSGSTATDANKLSNSTAIVQGTTYYVAFYDGLALCYSPTRAVTVKSSTLTEVTCSNNGTFENSTDDFLQFKITPATTSNYSVTATYGGSPVTITQLDNSAATNIMGGLPSYFKVSNGTLAVGGTFTITITPVSGSVETLTFTNTGTCSTTCTSASSGNTVTYYYYAPVIGQQDSVIEPALLPKFDQSNGRLLTNVSIEYGANYMGGVIIESKAATSQLTSYQESSINTFNISGYTLNRTVSLFNSGLVTIPAGISVPAQGSWLGDVNGLTMERMSISPDANWLNNTLLFGQNPTTSDNWVTNITGNPTHDDDMIILNNSFIPSTNTVNYSAQADLNNFIGTGNLSSSFSNIVSTSLAGSANLTFGQRLARSYFYKITYTYECGLVPAACYKPAVLDAGNTYPTKHGITSLGRAGTDSDNWPMVRQSAWTALEAKTKGFVVNRVKFNTSNQPVADDGTTLVITSPVEGMMVYDTTNNCLKVYTSNDGGSSFAWHCMSTQACPQ